MQTTICLLDLRAGINQIRLQMISHEAAVVQKEKIF